jgi:translation initiation factor IF-2
MTDKSIKELALNVGRPVEKLLEQVREAGLPKLTILLPPNNKTA